MSIPSPSRGTLQDVLNAIEAAPDVTAKRKQDLRSAVRLVVKVLGTQPELLVADPRGIGRRLDGVSHLSLGLSAGRWSNSKSLLRSALKLVGPVMPGASTVPLLPEWVPLADEARKVGACWLRLGRLLRWLSERRVTPAAVTRADLEQFRDTYLSDSLLGNPEKSWQAARQSWERMRVACPFWPAIALEAAPNPMVYSLPWAAFPPSLKVEVDRLIDRLTGKDLSDDGPARPLRPASLKAIEYQLRVFASALILKGADPQTLDSLAACLTLDNYKIGLAFFYERFGSRPGQTVHHMAAATKAVAKHWLKLEESTLAQMTRITARLTPPKQGMSDKNRNRLRPFDSQENVKAIANLPRTIERQLATATSATTRKIGLSTAAMAIEILLVTQLRLANLVHLHLDRHFIKVGRKTHLIVRREEVKNSVDLEYELPDETVEMLERFIRQHRRADPQNRYLFAGRGLSPKDDNAVRSQIMDAVRAFTGLTIHPHLFRHIAGTIYLRAHPGAYEVVRQMLGHRNTATTMRFYAGQEDRRARQHFIGEIQKLRESPVVLAPIERSKP